MFHLLPEQVQSCSPHSWPQSHSTHCSLLHIIISITTGIRINFSFDMIIITILIIIILIINILIILIIIIVY